MEAYLAGLSKDPQINWMTNLSKQSGNDSSKQENCDRRTFISTAIATFLMGRYITSNFTFNELACRGSGECKMDQDYMELLQQLRTEFDRPMVITSGYRSPDYNIKVSKTGSHGPHTTGRAVDVLISGKDAVRLFAMAQQMGMTGFGWNQKGPRNKRFIHLDNLPNIDGKQPRPHVWTY